ncbi:MAG: DUF2474 family protein [Burkholderiales bacterium]
MQPEGPPPEGAPRPAWRQRMLWLAAYWLAGVAAVATVAYLLRFVMGWAGLRP